RYRGQLIVSAYDRAFQLAAYTAVRTAHGFSYWLRVPQPAHGLQPKLDAFFFRLPMEGKHREGTRFESTRCRLCATAQYHRVLPGHAGYHPSPQACHRAAIYVRSYLLFHVHQLDESRPETWCILPRWVRPFGQPLWHHQGCQCGRGPAIPDLQCQFLAIHQNRSRCKALLTFRTQCQTGISCDGRLWVLIRELPHAPLFEAILFGWP